MTVHLRGPITASDDFPTYILKVLGRDWSWMEHGACRGHELARKKAWTCLPGDEVNGIEGGDLIKAALLVCRICPQQYLCALWAVEVEEESGTWAMPHNDLLWLIRQPDAEGIIHEARVKGLAVQDHVRQTQRLRRREARLARVNHDQ